MILNSVSSSAWSSVLYDFNVTDHSQVSFLVRKYLYVHTVEQILNLHKVETSIFISYGFSPKDKHWEKEQVINCKGWT